MAPRRPIFHPKKHPWKSCIHIPHPCYSSKNTKHIDGLSMDLRCSTIPVRMQKSLIRNNGWFCACALERAVKLRPGISAGALGKCLVKAPVHGIYSSKEKTNGVRVSILVSCQLSPVFKILEPFTAKHRSSAASMLWPRESPGIKVGCLHCYFFVQVK